MGLLFIVLVMVAEENSTGGHEMAQEKNFKCRVQVLPVPFFHLFLTLEDLRSER